MKNGIQITAFALVGAIVAATFGPVISSVEAAVPRAQKARQNIPPINGHGRAAVVFYGLGDEIWSDGMKEIAKRAGTKVYPWNKRESLQHSLIKAYRDGKIKYVVVAGHSFGANSANQLGNNLVKAGVPVRCVATLDPTDPQPVDRRVKRAVNFISRDNRGKKVKGAENIRRRDLKHVNMDNDKKIKAAVGQCLA